MFFRVSFLAAAVAASCISTQVIAADQLEEVVVTASRTEQPISEVIGSVTVITREEIEQRQAQSLQELLRGELGIDITNNGGLGQDTSFFMRGANSTQTLILVDGVRLGSATTGKTALQFIPVNQIERIEIIRGPRSSMYGSDAIGGVIQIFTRKANDFSATISAGEHDTSNISGAFGTNTKNLSINLAGTHEESAGINSCSIQSAALSKACYANEPDNDGYTNTSGTARIRYTTEQNTQIELSILHSQGNIESDGYFNHAEFEQNTPNIKIDVSPSHSLTLKLSAGTTNDFLDYFSSENLLLSRYRTQKSSNSIIADWKISSDQHVITGSDYLKDSIDVIYDSFDPSIKYINSMRTSHGEFISYFANLGDHHFNTALRHDASSQYGGVTTANAGWKWLPNRESFAINVGIGNAFHAPTFNDLYAPYSSDPDLKPERSKNIEAGISGNISWLNWSTQAFDTRFVDLIILDSTYSPINTDAHVRGIETTLNGEWDQFNLGVNYTYQTPRSTEAGETYDHLLPRRARQSGRITARYNLGNTQLSSIVNAIGPRFDSLKNNPNERMGGYTTIDLLASFSLNPNFMLDAKISNLLDRQYETAQYYNQEGRGIYLTLRYQPAK